MEINCGEIREAYEGKGVTVYGWCRRIRDHGGKLFVDLADRYGITQIVFEKDIKEAANELGREYAVKVTGMVREREPDTISHEYPTGKFEVYATHLDIIGKSLTPPFEITEEKDKFLPSEELRLKYRYLDFRREKMIKNIEFRDKITKSIRKFFWDNGFLELETPNLTKDSHDASGSRTFVVPSRTNKGRFYALPQSPQIYKQLCMIGGLDKYFQIARVFRDEDPREDRQPEFTQVDIEVSFKNETYIQALIEELLKRIFKEVLKKELEIPFPHMDYSVAIEEYGNDKPDLRFGYKIVDVTQEAGKSDYQTIKKIVHGGGTVKAIAFDTDFGGKNQKLDRNYMLELVETAKNFGLRGLTWMYVENGELRSYPDSISAAFKLVHKELSEKLEIRNGNIIVLGADLSENLLLSAMAKLRRVVGTYIGKFRKEYSFVWIDRFPLYEKDEVTGKLQPAHNPFVAPTESTLQFLDTKPEKVMGKRYDLVLNGIEIGGGSIRINDPELQYKVLEILGLGKEEIERSLGFLITALSYGAPIHGGIALGLDRLVAMLMGQDDIKDFILFPKNKKFESPLDLSPTPLDASRLRGDFNIKIEQS